MSTNKKTAKIREQHNKNQPLTINIVQVLFCPSKNNKTRSFRASNRGLLTCWDAGRQQIVSKLCNWSVTKRVNSLEFITTWATWKIAVMFNCHPNQFGSNDELPPSFATSMNPMKEARHGSRKPLIYVCLQKQAQLSCFATFNRTECQILAQFMREPKCWPESSMVSIYGSVSLRSEQMANWVTMRKFGCLF